MISPARQSASIRWKLRHTPTVRRAFGVVFSYVSNTPTRSVAEICCEFLRLLSCICCGTPKYTDTAEWNSNAPRILPLLSPLSRYVRTNAAKNAPHLQSRCIVSANGRSAINPPCFDCDTVGFPYFCPFSLALSLPVQNRPRVVPDGTARGFPCLPAQKNRFFLV